jgi:hypothetical protein
MWDLRRVTFGRSNPIRSVNSHDASLNWRQFLIIAAKLIIGVALHYIGRRGSGRNAVALFVVIIRGGDTPKITRFLRHPDLVVTSNFLSVLVVTKNSRFWWRHKKTHIWW